MKKFIVFGMVFFALIFLGNNVFAKKLLPRAQSVARPAIGAKTRGVAVGVKFRDDRLAIIVTLANLSLASKVDYTLSYNTRGTTQGAGGTINVPSTDTATRELLFGTCSHGVCRYDYGITNARLVVTTTLRSGLRVVKSFRIRV